MWLRRQQRGLGTVWRVLPCHCNLNAAELIWSYLGGCIARNSTSFRVQDIQSLLETAIQNIIAKKWSGYIYNVQWEEKITVAADWSSIIVGRYLSPRVSPVAMNVMKKVKILCQTWNICRLLNVTKCVSWTAVDRLWPCVYLYNAYIFTHHNNGIGYFSRN
jgi:hypothetical protein